MSTQVAHDRVDNRGCSLHRYPRVDRCRLSAWVGVPRVHGVFGEGAELPQSAPHRPIAGESGDKRIEVVRRLDRPLLRDEGGFHRLLGRLLCKEADVVRRDVLADECEQATASAQIEETLAQPILDLVADCFVHRAPLHLVARDRGWRR